MDVTKQCWQTDEGTITFMLSHGRVLQACVGGHDAFWENPDWSGNWNPGGDRLWIGPESDWSWQTLDELDFDQYELQDELDSGDWTVEAAGETCCRVRREVALRHQHNGSTTRFSLTRSFESLRIESPTLFDRYVAYQTDSALTLLDAPEGQRVDLWSIVQLPAGGKVHIGCHGTPEFRDYFTPIDADHWTAGEQMLSCNITGDAQYKVGVSPDAATGRMAYARKIDEGTIVIYRQFYPQAWRPYCDTPLLERESQGDAAQAFNDDGAFGGFGEMEYHTPALTAGTGRDHISDTSLTIVGIVANQQWPAWQKAWLTT